MSNDNDKRRALQVQYDVNSIIKEYIDQNGLNLTTGLVKIVEAIYDEQQDELDRQNNVGYTRLIEHDRVELA